MKAQQYHHLQHCITLRDENNCGVPQMKCIQAVQSNTYEEYGMNYTHK